MPSSAYSIQRQPPLIPTIGPTGAQGPIGNTGAAGANGQGVPASGASGSVLAKNSGSDYDTAWVTRATLAADAAFSALYLPVPTAWTNVSGGIGFANSWVDFGGSEQVARYRKIGDRVFLEGLIKSGTIGATAFTLPAGFRPPLKLYFATSSNHLYGSLDVDAAGVVQPNTGSNVFFSVNCSFSTI